MNIKNKTKLGQRTYKLANNLIPGGTMLFSKKPELHLPNLWPNYFSKVKDCYLWDIDGNKYIDMMFYVGTNALGYANKKIDNKVISSINKGNLSTLNNKEEVDLARELIKIHPWADMVRFARSGGEANAIAIRIARANTNKQNVAICGYHGWHDWYLATNIKSKKNLNQHLLKGIQTKGVPSNLKGSIFPFEYNNFNQLKNLIKKNKIGVICMEVMRNDYPKDNFLQKVRQIANKNNIVLIFDECTSGFRKNFGGLHLHFKVNPDIAIFGKALGNGYAITAVLGKKKIMDVAESSFISSTFWTERSGFTAAIKTIEIMKKKNSKKLIIKKGKKIKKIWNKLSKKHNINIKITGIDSICNFIFDYKNSNYLKSLLTYQMLRFGFLSNNTVMISISHSDKIIDQYEKALDKSFKYISKVINKKIKFTKKIKLAYKGFYRLN